MQDDSDGPSRELKEVSRRLAAESRARIGESRHAVDVASEALGPLGQIFGTRDAGLRSLGLTQAEAADCGFVSQPGVSTRHINDIWNKLVLTPK